MATDWAAEDWLLDAGEETEHKCMARGVDALTPAERLLREVWILDMETRNGGVSQYFCNHGVERWQQLQEAWLSSSAVPSLRPIIDAINGLIANCAAYQATLSASPAIERTTRSASRGS